KVFLTPDSVAPAGFARVALDAWQHRHVYALWNPYHFLGMPSFGSLTFVPYVYPLDVVFGFLNKTLHFPDLTWLLAHYLLLAFAMSAFLYLPTHEYSKLSVRGGGEGGGAGLTYATSWSFHPREILTFVIPSMFGFGGSTYWGSMPFTDYPNYMGIVALALAI